MKLVEVGLTEQVLTEEEELAPPPADRGDRQTKGGGARTELLE